MRYKSRDLFISLTKCVTTKIRYGISFSLLLNIIVIHIEFINVLIVKVALVAGCCQIWHNWYFVGN